MREWLVEMRNSLGLTLKEMGAALNISESYYLLIEQGKRQKRMDITLIKQLSQVSGKSMEEIIKLETGGE